MQLSGNTIFITGGGSGIGRALAEALLKEGNQIIISGRRRHVLDEVTRANPVVKAIELDVTDPADIRAKAAQLQKDFPKLNVVIHNAGIMPAENLLEPGEGLSDAEKTVRTNLLAPMHLTAALLPGLRNQPKATIVTVTSGLASVPLAMTPTYCATKAGLHSWTESLRWQLKQTNVEVIELAPPYVQTELTGPKQASDPRAMPLKDFIAEVMQLLKTQPNAKEILVERVKLLRFAEARGEYDKTFVMLNQMRESEQ